jgi:hypothetical protein
MLRQRKQDRDSIDVSHSDKIWHYSDLALFRLGGGIELANCLARLLRSVPFSHLDTATTYVY